MSAPLVTPSRDALAKALCPECSHPAQWHHVTGGCACFPGGGGALCPCRLSHADALIASGAVIDTATLADDETIRAVAYKYAEGEATYAASTVRHVLRALVDVLAERGEQHG